MKNRQEALEFLESLEKRIEALEARGDPEELEELQELRAKVADLEKRLEEKPKGILDKVADWIFDSGEQEA